MTTSTLVAFALLTALSVREQAGDYLVSARFTVPEPPVAARAVLVDYANIPRIMPDVRSSLVLERGTGTARVEQEAVSKFMFFTRRVHLVLDVEEGADVIRFRDVCNQSFVRYQGAWTIASRDGMTELTYELTARPAFGVPGFVLRKLLTRDADIMIDRLRAEIASRAVRLSADAPEP